MGDRLGLYKRWQATAPSRRPTWPSAPTAEPYIREWLNAQAAGGYVEYDPATRTYSLLPEQAMALADESSPAFLPGAFQIALGVVRDAPKIEAGPQRCRHRLARARPRRLRGLRAVLPPGLQRQPRLDVAPALEGVVGKLQTGAASPTSAAATARRRS